MLVLNRRETDRLLEGDRVQIIEAVRDAYVCHASGESTVPHSSFLRFPDGGPERIIALPAYRGGDNPVAGLKWVSSWPGNAAAGMERASAVVVLNSMRTGRPEAVLEGSGISAHRTAASAALAAGVLHPPAPDLAIGFVGCGRINLEVARYLAAAGWAPARIVAQDVRPDRSEAMGRACEALWPGATTTVVERAEDALAAAPLVAMATTQTAPHVEDGCLREDGTVLHLSLRDFAPATVLAATNVVDDVGHVCREQTSVHLAEQAVGHRSFIAGTLGVILTGAWEWARPPGPVLFSPFGLGVLDVSVATLVRDEASSRGIGTILEGFSDPAGERAATR